MNGLTFTFAVGAGLVAASAMGDDGGKIDPISTDRPSFSDGPVIVPVGHFQVESGFTRTSFPGGTSNTFPEVLARLALSSRFEIRLINFTYQAGNAPTGFQDPAIGFKYQLLGGRNSVALVGLSTAPLGSPALRTNRSQPTGKVAWEYAAHAATTFGANVSASNLGDSPGRFSQYYVSAYVNRAFSWRTGGYLEWYDVMPTAKDGPSANFADIGATYLLDNSTQVDFRIGSGFDERRDGWYVGAGISYRF